MAVPSPRASGRGFPVAPEAYYSDLSQMNEESDPKRFFQQMIEWTRQIAETHNRTQAGKTNNLGTLTLTASATSSTVTDARIGPNTILHMTPIESDAATRTWWQTYPNVTLGEAVINHDSDPSEDRTYVYTLNG